jgi:mannose-6-phosphate isomerase
MDMENNAGKPTEEYVDLMGNSHKKYLEERPWGKFEQFTFNEVSTVKILTIKEGEHPSLQFHYHRDELWRVIKGKVSITLSDKKIIAQEGDELFIPRGTKHTAEGVDGDADILEISYGKFDENDIVRVEDKYGRASPV